jgi:hypothetical protein
MERTGVVEIILPALILLDEYHGDWNAYVDALYKIYSCEIVQGGLTFRNIPVRCRFHPPTKGKGFGFWHVVSSGPSEDDRIPDFRRCERIRWVAWTIFHAHESRVVSWWENTRGGSTHVVLWLEEFDYAVILARRSGYYLLKSAYCVDNHRRKVFSKERETWRRAQKD